MSLPPAQYSDPFPENKQTHREREEENGVYMRYSKREKNRPGSVNIYTYGPRSHATFMEEILGNLGGLLLLRNK